MASAVLRRGAAEAESVTENRYSCLYRVGMSSPVRGALKNERFSPVVLSGLGTGPASPPLLTGNASLS